MMTNLCKLGKDDHIMHKDKAKDGSKPGALASKSTKKQLPLPPQHHPHQAMIAPSPLLAIATPSTSTSTPNMLLPSSSSSSSIAFSLAPPSSPFSANPVLSSASSMMSPMALLREILNSIAAQRNQILGLINSIDPTFLASANPKSLSEHKLLNQVAELQGKILDMNEEIHHMRAKNSQLEQQLSLFQGKRGAS